MPSRRKEIHFFDHNHKKGVGWYEAFFSRAPEKSVIGEVTPTYLANPAVPARVKEVLPEAKFIIILRNPVERAFSHYKYAKMKWALEGDFAEVAKQKPMILERGHYEKSLQRWLKLFPRKQFLILILEEIHENPEASLKRVGAFLGVNEEGFKPKKGANPSGEARSPALNQALYKTAAALRRKDIDWPVRLAKRLGLERFLLKEAKGEHLSTGLEKRLRKEYAPTRRALEKLLGRRTGWWQ